MPPSATLSGSTSGTVGVQSTAFTVSVNQPASTGGVTVTPTSSVATDTAGASRTGSPQGSNPLGRPGLFSFPELNRGRHSLHGLNQYLGVSLRVEIDKTEALRSEALAVAKEIRAEGDIVNCESVLGKMGSLSVSSYSPHSMRAIHLIEGGGRRRNAPSV